MAERRPLVEGLKTAPPAAPTSREREFVYGSKAVASDPNPAPAASPNVPSSPLSTRIRADVATALKRASLDRQLKGQEPSTIREILEQAIEPWLRENGYLS